MPASRPIAVGRVGRPHGLKGEVRIDPMGGMPRGLDGYTRFFLGRGAELRPVEVISHRRHGRFLLVKFHGVDCPEEAARLTHEVLHVDRAEMPPLEEGEYYYADLLGCRVLDEAGAEVGRVDDVFRTGEHDVLVVSAAASQWMLPVVTEYVGTIDTERGVIEVKQAKRLRG